VVFAPRPDSSFVVTAEAVLAALADLVRGKATLGKENEKKRRRGEKKKEGRRHGRCFRDVRKRYKGAKEAV